MNSRPRVTLSTSAAYGHVAGSDTRSIPALLLHGARGRAARAQDGGEVEQPVQMEFR